MVNVGLQIGSLIPRPSAIPCVNTVFPTPRSPINVYTSPGFACCPIFFRGRASLREKMSRSLSLSYRYPSCQMSPTAFLHDVLAASHLQFLQDPYTVLPTALSE